MAEATEVLDGLALVMILEVVTVETIEMEGVLAQVKIRKVWLFIYKS